MLTGISLPVNLKELWCCVNDYRTFAKARVLNSTKRKELLMCEGESKVSYVCIT